jgi:hypothetical protein
MFSNSTRHTCFIRPLLAFCDVQLAQGVELGGRSMGSCLLEMSNGCPFTRTKVVVGDDLSSGGVAIIPSSCNTKY